MTLSFYGYIAGLGGVLHILLGIDLILAIECLLTFANWLFSFFGWCYNLSKKTTETQQNVENQPKIEPFRTALKKTKIIVVRPATTAV